MVYVNQLVRDEQSMAAVFLSDFCFPPSGSFSSIIVNRPEESCEQLAVEQDGRGSTLDLIFNVDRYTLSPPSALLPSRNLTTLSYRSACGLGTGSILAIALSIGGVLLLIGAFGVLLTFNQKLRTMVFPFRNRDNRGITTLDLGINKQPLLHDSFDDE